MRLKRVKRIVTIVIIVLCLVAAATGFYGAYENKQLTVTEYTVTDEKIPESFSGFKIAQVSDLHNTGLKELEDKTVKALENAKPDIIVITGDLIDSRNTRIDRALDFVERITPIAPAYFVTGNHESRTEEYPRLENGLKNLGVTVLENECEVLEKDGEKINLVGVEDFEFKRETGVGGIRMVKKDFRRAMADRDFYTVLLIHHPEYAEAFASLKVDLTLAGHAHGGQVRLPFIGGVYAPNQGFFPKYYGGLYELSETSTMIVSRGLGNSLFPFRINNPPELVTVTLEHSE